MSVDLGKLGYKVFINDKEYRESLRKMLGETQNSSNEIKGIFSKLATSAILGTVFYKSIGQARAFSKELANIKSIAWDLDMGKVRQEILDLDAALGNSAELANAMYFAYSAGVRGTEKELAKFTALTAELAQTVGSGITPMMDALTTMLNAYNLKVGYAGNLTDWFYQIVKSGKTTGSELAQSLGQIAATAASAGISLDELGAALATLTTTMPTNIAVTSLAAAIRAIVNPTEDAKNSARALGIDLSQTAIQAKGFSGVMQEIFDKTQGRADLIGKIFPAESSRAILSLAGTQLETFKNTLTDFEGKAGNAKKGFEAILESDDKKWEAMLTVARKLGVAIGDIIFNILTLGGILNPVYSAINDMGAGTIKLIAQIGAFAGVMVVLSKTAGAMKTLKDAFTGLSIKGGFKTAGMLTAETEQNKQTSAALQAEKEGAIRIAVEKRVALAKANAAMEDAIRNQQSIISARAVEEARIIAEQNARVQAVQTAQAAVVAEKTKELAVARSVATQIALEKQRHMFELQNRASILPHLIAQKEQEIALAVQSGTLSKAQTSSLAALKREYANISHNIQKATKESVKSANAAKLARKAEIDGIAQANVNAQKKIAQAQTSASNAIAAAQKTTQTATANAAQSVQRATADAQKAANTYHTARNAATQAAAAQQTHNAAVAAGTVQVGFLKGAVKGLWGIIAANPIGAILTGATLAYSAIMYILNRAEEKAKEKLEAANKLMEEAEGRKQKTEENVKRDTPKLARLEELSKKENLSATEMKEVENELNKLSIEWGDLGIELDKNNSRLIAQANAFDLLREKMKKARLEANIREQKAVEGKKSVLEEQERENLKSQGFEYMTEYAITQTQIKDLKKEDQEKARKEYFKNLSDEDKKFREDMNKVLAEKGLSLDNINMGNPEYQKALSLVAKQRLTANNKEYKTLSKRALTLSAERKEIRSGRDPEKEQLEKERVANAQKETARLEGQWKENDLSENDKKERMIQKEYDLYMKNLNILKESKNISDEEYEKRAAQAHFRKETQIDANKLSRNKEIAILAAQEKAWADGRVTAEEQILIRKKEILYLEKELARLQKLSGKAKGPEEKRNLALSISRTKTLIAQKKGENKTALDDYKYERTEKDRQLKMETARSMYARDGQLSEQDQIALKKLELAQQTERIKELETRRNKAVTEEMKKQFALQKAQADSKKSLLAEEIRQAEQKRKLETSERKRNSELLSLQIAQKKDGIVTDQEKKDLLALQISQQRERIAEFQTQENSLLKQKGKEDLLARIKEQKLQAENALSDLVMEQSNKRSGTKNAQGSFSASVLSMMSSSPIELKQLQKMTEVREDLRKLERRSRKQNSSTSTYTS